MMPPSIRKQDIKTITSGLEYHQRMPPNFKDNACKIWFAIKRTH